MERNLTFVPSLLSASAEQYTEHSEKEGNYIMCEHKPIMVSIKIKKDMIAAWLAKFVGCLVTPTRSIISAKDAVGRLLTIHFLGAFKRHSSIYFKE